MAKKIVLMAILTIALVFGMAVVGCGGGGDDGGGGGGGNGENGFIDGWKWYTEGDSFQGGTSTITMTQGSGNDSKKLTFSGNVRNIPGQGFGYANCKAKPNSANLAALKTADSISFQCKGDGKTYIVEVRMSDIGAETNFNYHQKTFTASSAESTITIQYSDLIQTWGTQIPFNKNNITSITFQAHSSYIGGEGPFNFTIWDLKAGSSTGGGNPVTPGSGGTFTLTGIPSDYNGKYAYLQAEEWTSTSTGSSSKIIAAGFQNFNSETLTITLCKISNGSVSLPLWVWDDSNSIFKRYSGNGTYTVLFGVFNSQNVVNLDFPDEVDSRGFDSVTFSSGSATRSWSQRKN